MAHFVTQFWGVVCQGKELVLYIKSIYLWGEGVNKWEYEWGYVSFISDRLIRGFLNSWRQQEIQMKTFQIKAKQRHIQDPVKHLAWIFYEKIINNSLTHLYFSAFISIKLLFNIARLHITRTYHLQHRCQGPLADFITLSGILDTIWLLPCSSTSCVLDKI